MIRKTKFEVALFVVFTLVASSQGFTMFALGTGDLHREAFPPLTGYFLDPPSPNGCNGWYASNVTFTLVAADEDSGVKTTKYKIDDGSWMEGWGTPVTITASGRHTVYYYSIDNADNTELTKNFSINIDKEIPQIANSHRYLFFWIKYFASVSDSYSGVDRVEFYLNDKLMYNDTQAPYQWVLHPIPHGNYSETQIVIDKAGNSAQSETTSEPLPGYTTGHSYSFLNNDDNMGKDDIKSNNAKNLRIRIDDTPPLTGYFLTPSKPNGCNGWYVSNVTFTLVAADESSGIEKTFYKVDNGSWMEGWGIPVTITTSGLCTVFYYSIDNAKQYRDH